MFNKGDKVTHETYGDGEVIGPNLYVINFKGDGIRNVAEQELKAVPKYRIGQAVTFYGRPATVLSEAFTDSDGSQSYVCRFSSSGNCVLLLGSELE